MVSLDGKYSRCLMGRSSTRGLTMGNFISCPRRLGQHHQVFPDVSRGRGARERLHHRFQGHCGAVGPHSGQSGRLDVGARVPVQGKTGGAGTPSGWTGRQTTKSRPFSCCRNGKVWGFGLKAAMLQEKKHPALSLTLSTLQMSQQEGNSRAQSLAHSLGYPWPSQIKHNSVWVSNLPLS